MKTIHVVVSCTDRKRHPVPPGRRLREVDASDRGSRARKWIERIEGGDDDCVPALDLYAGEHWVEVRRILDGRRDGAKLVGWVVSAGYGLIPVTARVSAYQATFQRGHRDSAVPVGAEWTEADWWQELVGWAGPAPGQPRSVADLARVAGDDVLLVALSARYRQALDRDLALLAREADADRVGIFVGNEKAETSRRGRLAIPIDSRLLTPFGGSRIGLYARVLGHAVREAGVHGVSEMRESVARLMRSTKRQPVPIREAAADKEVLEFIEMELEANPKARPTPLLRRWRNLGRACEQARFKTLFMAARPETDRPINGAMSDRGGGV